MDGDSIIAIFIAVIGSNALWGFIQFLLQRKDNKEDRLKKIIEMIKKLDEKFEEKIVEFDNKLNQRNEQLNKKIDKLNGEFDEHGAIACRVRILKFMDEILEGWGHSHDSYVQVMQKGVSSIVNQYYLSTSNTTQIGGSWSTTVPPYVEDCYYWTKSHIVYVG